MLFTTESLRTTICWLLLGLSCMGLVFVFLGSAAFPPLDEPALVVYSMKYSIPAGLLLTVCSYLLLGKPLFLGQYCWVLPVAIMTTVFINGAAIAYHFNARADAGEGIRKQLNITSKRSLNIRGKNNYYVVVTSWRPGRKEERLKVQRSEYQSLVLPAEIQFTLKPGALSYLWVEEYSLIER